MVQITRQPTLLERAGAVIEENVHHARDVAAMGASQARSIIAQNAGQTRDVAEEGTGQARTVIEENLDQARAVIEEGAGQAREAFQAVAGRAREAIEAADFDAASIEASIRRIIRQLQGEPECTEPVQEARDRERLKAAIIAGVVLFVASALVLLTARLIATRRAEAERRRLRPVETTAVEPTMGSDAVTAEPVVAPEEDVSP